MLKRFRDDGQLRVRIRPGSGRGSGRLADGQDRIGGAAVDHLGGVGDRLEEDLGRLPAEVEGVPGQEVAFEVDGVSRGPSAACILTPVFDGNTTQPLSRS